MTYIAVLGRQPEFGLAELESLLGANAITPMPNNLGLLSHADEIPFTRFGSVIKFARVIEALSDGKSARVISALCTYLTESNPYQKNVKLKIGISDYSKNFNKYELGKIGLAIKKELRQNGYSVRIIPNTSTILSSAQIIHNQLTKEHGTEIVLFSDGEGTLSFAVTVYEQDIEAYAARDQKRPMRDARVGMLPPKLAQTIINLATGGQDATSKVVLDPFCGTGVIMQESLLMGYSAYGTDLEPRMIDYTNKNLDWLSLTHHANYKYQLETADATAYHWQQPIEFIATETYLGRPLSAIPSQRELVDLMQSVNTIHKKFLKNLFNQISPVTRICLAVPAWRTHTGFAHLPVLDQLADLGYNQLVFSHVDAKNLVYARGHQFVARQLVVLQKRNAV